MLWGFGVLCGFGVLWGLPLTTSRGARAPRKVQPPQCLSPQTSVPPGAAPHLHAGPHLAAEEEQHRGALAPLPGHRPAGIPPGRPRERAGHTGEQPGAAPECGAVPSVPSSPCPCTAPRKAWSSRPGLRAPPSSAPSSRAKPWRRCSTGGGTRWWWPCRATPCPCTWTAPPSPPSRWDRGGRSPRRATPSWGWTRCAAPRSG